MLHLPPRRRRRAFLGFALFLLLAPGLWGVLDGLRALPRGLNDAGAEFRGPDRSGLPLALSAPAALEAMARRGFTIVRLPFRWETVQPELGGPLAPQAVEDLKGYVREAERRGLGVILDPHNFARYTWTDGNGQEQVGVVGTPPVTSEAFSDFWRRMSREFRAEPGVWAYCLMNEPHDLGTRHWEQASQAAVEAIRAEGDPTRILVPGSNYSSAHVWVLCHGRDAWIRDPLNRFAYEAHCYFDRTASGAYDLPYEEEARLDPDLETRSTRRLQVFVDWCESNGVEGFIGEFGCPPDPRWIAHLDRFLALMDRGHLGGTAWASGDAWPEDYHLLLRDRPDGSPRPQMAVLEAHLGPWGPGQVGSDFARGYRILYLRARMAARQARDQFRAWRKGEA